LNHKFIKTILFKELTETSLENEKADMSNRVDNRQMFR